MANNDKLVRLSNLKNLTQQLDDRFKKGLDGLDSSINDTLNNKADITYVEEELGELEDMFGGKSIVYLTQAEYDLLSDAEKENESIAYFITDAVELEFVSQLVNDARYTSDTQVKEMIGGKEIRYVTQAEYDVLSDREKEDVNFIYFITDARGLQNVSELENDAEYVSKTEVNEMLGGRHLRYLTQAEYNGLSDEEKLNPNVYYNITDEERDNQFDSIVLRSPNGSLFRLSVDDDGAIISNKIS